MPFGFFCFFLVAPVLEKVQALMIKKESGWVRERGARAEVD